MHALYVVQSTHLTSVQCPLQTVSAMAMKHILILVYCHVVSPLTIMPKIHYTRFPVAKLSCQLVADL